MSTIKKADNALEHLLDIFHLIKNAWYNGEDVQNSSSEPASFKSQFLYTSLFTFHNSGSDRYNCTHSRQNALFALISDILKRRCERCDSQWRTGDLVQPLSSMTIHASNCTREYPKYSGLVPPSKQQLWKREAPVDGRTTMSSESVCQVARSWVDMSSFHMRLVVRFMNIFLHPHSTTWYLRNEIQTSLKIGKPFHKQSNHTTHDQVDYVTACVAQNVWPCMGPFG
jgi:hypothetical protein